MNNCELYGKISDRIKSLGLDVQSDEDLFGVFCLCRVMIETVKQEKIGIADFFINTSEGMNRFFRFIEIFDRALNFLSDDHNKKNLIDICNLMIQRSLISAESFFAVMSPFIVYDWKGFTESFPKGTKHGQICLTNGENI